MLSIPNSRNLYVFNVQIAVANWFGISAVREYSPEWTPRSVSEAENVRGKDQDYPGAR